MQERARAVALAFIWVKVVGKAVLRVTLLPLCERILRTTEENESQVPCIGTGLHSTIQVSTAKLTDSVQLT